MSEFTPPAGAIVSEQQDQLDFISPAGAIVSDVEPANKILEEKVQQPEVDIEAIKKQKALDFKKGRFLMSEIKAKEKFDLTGEVDINLLSEESLNPEKSLY